MTERFPPLTISQTSSLTLVDRIISRSLATDIVLVLAGVMLTALAAQIQVPAWPVPFTLQTLAVLLIGATYGTARGAITMGLYALVGFMGAPVFADFSSGMGVVFGPTGGFIIGFIFAAALTGRFSELNWSSNAFKMFVSYSLGSLVIYAIGIPVLAMTVYGSDLITAAVSMRDYLIWDAAKALVAAALLPSAWLLVKSLKK